MATAAGVDRHRDRTAYCAEYSVTDLLVTLLSVSLGALLYTYVGYLLALKVIVKIRGPRPIQRAPIAPPLTLVISAYNEAAVIRQKIENALALDYPVENREILV